MGAWGVSIFSDDLACDIRDDYKELLGEGFSGEESTKKILKQYNPNKKDPEEYTVLWLSLAATQWQLGRLEEDVKKKAIDIIDSDMNLKVWESDEEVSKGDCNKRKKVLLKLKEQLLSPQPAKKKVKKVVKYFTDFKIGDVFSYQYKLDQYIIFRVIDVAEFKTSSYPVCEVCDWIGNVLPSIDEIINLKARKNKFNEDSHIWIVQNKKNEYPADRLKIIAKNITIPRERYSSPLPSWSELDEFLSDYFGFE